MIYYVIELQSGDSGAGIVTAFTDRTLAEVDFHTKAGFAAASSVKKHSVIMLNEDAFQIKDPEVYVHGATTQATQAMQETQETPEAEE